MIGGLKAGRMDRKITIQKKVTTRDNTYGQPNYSYTNVATVWAERGAPPLNRSSEQEQGNKIVSRRLARYTIRYSTTTSVIDETMRILDGAETYEITDVAIRKREGYIRIDGAFLGMAT
jgi:SPP1 family predicted phage head-tail adaptor